MSCGSSTTELPPSWCMATSKETRVRVEGFSKIMASTGPRLNLSSFGTRPLRFIAPAQSMMARSVFASNASISRKCRGDMRYPAGSSVGERAALERDTGRIELGAGLIDLGFSRDQGRQEPYDIVAGLDRQQLLGAERCEQLLV